MYVVEVDDEVHAAVAALLASALPALAEAFAFLELTPWAAPSANVARPEAELRNLPFGEAGLLTVLVLERDRRVDVVRLIWGL